jgi:hypothetical protein
MENRRLRLMNTPAGSQFVNGQPVNILPQKATMNSAAFPECLNKTVIAYAATAFIR